MVAHVSKLDRDWHVPAFSENAFQDRQSAYALCIFILNEGGRIHAQLERTRPFASDVDIVIADGGSTDGSTDPRPLQRLGVNTLLEKHGPGRLSAQMRMALAYCCQRGYEGVIVMDGNNKDDPEAVPRFVHALSDGYDHTQGSRFLKGGHAVRTPVSRWLGIRLLHAPMIRWAAQFPYTDTTNGFRAYSRRLLLDPRVAPFRSCFSGYELHYYLAVRAARLGFNIREVPVTRAYPVSEPTPTKIHGVRGNVRVLRTLMDACLHRFDPDCSRPAPRGDIEIRTNSEPEALAKDAAFLR